MELGDHVFTRYYEGVRCEVAVMFNKLEEILGAEDGSEGFYGPLIVPSNVFNIAIRR